MCTLLLAAACEMPTPGDNGGGNGNGNGSGNNGTVDISISIADVPSATVVEGGTINLNATAAATRNNARVDITSYNWELVTPQGGLAGVNILTPNEARTQVQLPFLSTIPVGQSLNLGFQVTVTAGGETSTSTRTVSLNNDPFRATVNIGTNQTSSAQSPLAERSSIMLNSEGSTTSGGTPSYLWEQVNPRPGVAPAQFTNPNAASTSVTLPYSELANDTVTIRLSIFNGDEIDSNTTTVHIERGNIDADGDGLIDIRGLTMLHNMRYSLGGEHSLGTGNVDYRTSADATTGDTSGCPMVAGTPTCIGYELIHDLNFDADGDGSSWTGSNGSYTLDTGDVQAPYFTIAQEGTGGWEPVGSSANFTSIFDGNGFTIFNMATIQTSESGLFGNISEPAQVRNIHLRNGLSVGQGRAAILIATALADSILVSSSSIGEVRSDNDSAGLVGSNSADIIASYSSASIFITNQNAGGIAGRQQSEQIIASYASGSVTIENTSGVLTAAAGALVGGNVGSPVFTVISSYATGNASAQQAAGSLVGFINLSGGGTVTESYGFGTATDTNGGGGDFAPNSFSSTLPTVPDGNTGTRPITVGELTAANAGDTWNCTTSSTNAACTATTTRGAWDFTRRAANGGPSLMYADYDGTGNLFYCAGQPEPSYDSTSEPRPVRIANCEQHLPHQFGEN